MLQSFFASVLWLFSSAAAADTPAVLPPCEPVEQQMCDAIAQTLRSAKESDKALQITLFRVGGGGSVKNKETMFEPTDEKNDQLYSAKLACDAAVKQASLMTVKRFWSAYGEAIGQPDGYACDGSIATSAISVPAPAQPISTSAPQFAEAAPVLPAATPRTITEPKSAPNPQPAAGCRLFTPFDEAQLELELKNRVGVIEMWDQKAKQGFIYSDRFKKELPITISSDGHLEVAASKAERFKEMRKDYVRYRLGDTAQLPGWSIYHDLSPSYLVRGKERISMDKLTYENTEQSYLVAGSRTFLLTTSADIGEQVLITVRSWTVDPACLPR